MDDDDAIAVVGVGGKFPGANNIEEFWKVLLNGENHVKEIQKERWNVDAFYSSDPDTPGKTYVRKAGLLERYDEFDAKLFGISDIEADRMDPQQRYVLECVHMALEDGGITRSAVNGSDTGVFIGTMNDDYKGFTSDELATMTNYTLTGSSTSIISARVSYIYNLLGPSMVIDTACSSALVAIDVAAQHLKSGRCEMVICGGVNSILDPSLFVPLSRAKMVSPTGQSQAFSDKADGYARGEGCGIIVLKKLGNAKRDSNKIWATIATDCNQDGHTATPITAPSGLQQEKLLKRIYKANNVNPASIQVIEAHGTGTPVGDPIEVNCLGGFFSRFKNQRSRIYIASVKTNIGHLESAAGVAGLIKLLLMMKNKTIVPSLLLEKLNPNIKFSQFNFSVPLEKIPWVCSDSNRMACANSFGFGGTNSHVIVKEYIPQTKQSNTRTDCSHHLVLLSATDEKGLNIVIQNFERDLNDSDESLCDVSYTSSCRRDHFPVRKGLVVFDRFDLLSKLKKALGEKPVHQKFLPTKVIAVFCGVGTTWKGMGYELLQQHILFKDTVLKVDKILKEFKNFSIYRILNNKEDVGDPFTAHMSIFTIQVALWELWRSLDLTVNTVVGQSVGEIAAAYAVGCLTLEQAVKIAYLRSTILSEIDGGVMFVIGNCQVKYIESVCRKFSGKANIAVYNSPYSCTISSDIDIQNDLKDEIRRGLSKAELDELLVRDLNVKCAYHSHHTRTAGTTLVNRLKTLSVKSPLIELISTVNGKKVSTACHEGSYWGRNVSEPVLFQQAIQHAINKDKFNIFIEIGPKPVIRTHLPALCEPDHATSIPSMLPPNDNLSLLTAAASLFERGVSLNWKETMRCNGTLCDQPKHAFYPSHRGLFFSETTLLWNEGVQSNNEDHLFVTRAHGDTETFRITISKEVAWFVFQHFVTKTVVVPGAFHVEVAIEVSHRYLKTRPFDIMVRVDFIRPFMLSSDKTYHEFIVLESLSKNSVKGLITKGEETIASFESQILSKTLNAERIELSKIRRSCDIAFEKEEVYQTLQQLGFEYGDSIKILGKSFQGKAKSISHMHVSDEIWADRMKTNLHPAILDAMTQTVAILNSRNNDNEQVLPVGIEELILRRAVEKEMLVYTEEIMKSDQFMCYDILLVTQRGSIIAEVKNFRIQFISQSISNASLGYDLAWEEEIMKTEEKEMKTNDKPTLLFSFDKDILKELNLRFSSNVMICLPIEISLTMEEQKEHIKNIFTREKSVNQIYFLPYADMKENISGHKIFQITKDSLLFILCLVQYLHKECQKIPITIITENTQNPESNPNVCGSELWGQARSILKEQDEIAIQLIDCRPSIRKSLDFIESLLLRKIRNDFGEIIVDRDKIYSSCLQHLLQDDMNQTYRETLIDETCNVEMKTERSNDISKCFCVLQPDTHIRNNNCVQVELKDVYLHNKELHSISIFGLHMHKSNIEDRNKDGFSLISFEASGQCFLPDTPSKLTKVVILYPVSVQRYVEVPESCIFPSHKFPHNYQIGTLLLSTLMYAITVEVQNGESVYVYSDSFSSARVLEDFLVNIKKCNITKNITKASVIIALQDIRDEFINRIILIASIRAFLCYSNMTTTDQRIALERRNIYVKVLHADRVLSKQYLEEHGKKVYEMIQHISEDIAIQIDNNAKSSNSMWSGQMKSLKHDNLQNMVLRLQKHQLFRPNCCYIVIGGLTGLGWEIVKLLSSFGAGEVISISRRIPDKDSEAKMNNLCMKTKCRIRALPVDICNWDELFRVFKTIEETTTCKIKGIFQGAGILRDVQTMQMTEDQLIDVLKPKVLGSWNLHRIGELYPLDYFVMHSSMTSILGNNGQSNYGAANAFLDSLAHYRRCKGLCGQRINWGPLKVGMVKEGSSLEKFLDHQGYTSLSIDEINECFISALQSNKVQVIFGSFNWDKITANLAHIGNEHVKHKFRKVQHLSTPNGKSKDFELNDKWIEITKLPSKDRVSRISDIVVKTAAEAFGISAEDLSEDVFIVDLGIDSMQAMTFVNSMSDIAGYRIPIVKLMSDETTFRGIIDLLNENIKDKSIVSPQNETEDDTHPSSNMLTPYEFKFFKTFRTVKSYPALVIFADLEVFNKMADVSIWREILLKIHLKHPTLRTLLVPNQEQPNGVSKELLKANEIMVDLRHVRVEDLEHHEKFPQKIEDLLFDPSKDLPFRVLFARNENKCLLRLVFNQLAVDLSSVVIIVKDIFRIATRPNALIKDVNEMKATAAFENRFRHSHVHLEEFWEQNTPTNLMPMSLNRHLRGSLNPEKFNFISLQVEESIIIQLRRFLMRENVSLFDVVVTVYQFCLRQELRKDVITLLTPVDMRLHFPEFRDTVMRFTNTIPLYAEFEEDCNIFRFLKRNKMSISSFIENSLLPHDEIVKHIKEISPADLCRHNLVMAQIKDLGDFLDNKSDSQVQIRKVGAGSFLTETSLLVWNNVDKNYLNFELVYSTEVMDTQRANKLLNQINQIIKNLMNEDQSNVTVPRSRDVNGDQLPQMKTPNHAFKIEDMNDNESMGNTNENVGNRIVEKAECVEGTFLKQTKYGWYHQVFLQITNTKGGLKLCWGNHQDSRVIDLNDITKLETADMNGKYFMYIHTARRTYTFSTYDCSKRTEFEQSISKPNLETSHL